MLKTYSREIPMLPTTPRERMRLPVVPLGESLEWDGELEPGQLVRHQNDTGFGIIIAVDCDSVTVMWTDPPRELSGFTNIALPLVRRVQPQLIANSIVGIQPMTRPVGQIFYLDYVYGDGKKLEELKLSRARRAWNRVRRIPQDVIRVISRVPWLLILVAATTATVIWLCFHLGLL